MTRLRQMLLAGGSSLFIVLAACQTAPDPDTLPDFERDGMMARIPIHEFAGYDPYPPGYTGAIHAYVQFQRDGIVRATLGCETLSGTYRFLTDDTVVITGKAGMILPTYDDADCAPDLVERERSLAAFLESRPRIYPHCEDGCYRVLRSNGIVLDLRSVSDVLEYD